MMHDWGGGWGMILWPFYLVIWLAIIALDGRRWSRFIADDQHRPRHPG